MKLHHFLFECRRFHAEKALRQIGMVHVDRVGLRACWQPAYVTPESCY